MEIREVNNQIRALMKRGHGTIRVKNPRGKHSLGVGILNRLNLIFEGSLGYFGVGLIDGPNVRITGRVGWSCARKHDGGHGRDRKERRLDLWRGDSRRRSGVQGLGWVADGIDQKGGTIIVGGDTGALSGFMMQRGRMVVCWRCRQEPRRLHV